MTHTSATTSHQVTLTEAAARVAGDLISQDERQNLRLRLGVHPGGCGVSYDLYLDDLVGPEDLVSGFYGIDLVVDAASAPLLVGARIDFSAIPGRQGFTIDNPSAGGSGCCG